jgi:hypothetical protein
MSRVHFTKSFLGENAVVLAESRGKRTRLDNLIYALGITFVAGP